MPNPKKAASNKRVAARKKVPAKKPVKKVTAIKEAKPRTAKKIIDKVPPAGENFLSKIHIFESPNETERQLNELVKKIEDHQSGNGTASNVQKSFKASIHNQIVTHEMQLTKEEVEKKLANCGNVYYVTEAEIKKQQRRRNMQIAQAISWFAGAVIIAYIFGQVRGREDTIDYVNANYKCIPKTV